MTNKNINVESTSITKIDVKTVFEMKITMSQYRKLYRTVIKS